MDVAEEITFDGWLAKYGNMTAYSGRPFNFLDVEHNDITLADVAKAVSNLCRFTGHVREFYSVAQHQVLVSYILEFLGHPEFAYTGVCHDMAEAFLGDVGRPLKFLLERYPEFYRLRDRVEVAIAKTFNYTYPFPAEIKIADNLALFVEAKSLTNIDTAHFDFDLKEEVIERFGDFRCWFPSEAEERFLLRFDELRPK